jgi:hypothetical protein
MPTDPDPVKGLRETRTGSMSSEPMTEEQEFLAEADALWSAPESGQPPGGREPPPEELAHARGPVDTPPSESNGEDF